MAVLVIDSFNRANSSDLGASWTPVNDGFHGGLSMILQSNRADPSDFADDCAEYYSALEVSVDHWAEITLANTGGGLGTGSGPIVRCFPGSNFAYYRLVAATDGWELTLWGNGSFQGTITNNGGVSFADGDRIYLEARGNVLTGKKNTTLGVGGTTLFSLVDSNHVTQTRFGLAYSSTTTTVADAFAGGDFTSTGLPSVSRMHALRVGR